MPIRLALVFIVACAIIAVLAAPRMDITCLAEQALDLTSDKHKRWSCLHYAANRGDTSVIRRMLKHGADIDQRNASGRTPLAEAAKSGRLEAAKLLLGKGAEVNVYDTESGFTPLHLAAQQNHPAIVRRLLAEGADVNARNQWNQTALWQSAWQDWHNSTEVAHVLIAHGAQIDLADEKEHTPLHMAARSGHTAMLKYLVDQGADVNHANYQGRTPIYQAVIGNHLQATSLLLEAGADPNTAAEDRTPLRVALEYHHLEMADLLQAHGAENYEQFVADVRLEEGYLQFKAKKIDTAIQVFNSDIAARPDNSRAYYYRGLAYFETGNSNKALQDLNKAVQLDPNNTGALESLGVVYSDLEDFEPAHQALGKLVELRPDYGRAYYLLARSESALGNPKKASTGHSKSCSLGYRPACNE